MKIRALIFDYYGVLSRQVHGGWQLDMSLVNLIQNLRRNYIIGLLSNTYATSLSGLNPKLDETLFDLVLLGGATDLWKPNQETFVQLSHTLKLSPAEILIIDDNKTYIEVAAKLGFSTLLYREAAQLHNFLATK